MSYITVEIGNATIDLTPAVVKDLKRQIQAQLPKLAVRDLLEMAGALDLTLGQILAMVKGVKKGVLL
jgi:hypothetical protein